MSDETRDELFSAAAEMAGPQAGAQVADLLARYYRHVATQDLVLRNPEDLLGMALTHRDLAQQRPGGTERVRVFTPTVDEDTWSTGATVIQAVTDDMPFLVDSVTAELTRLGHPIQLIVHPQLVVRRDVMGELTEVLDLDAGQAPADAIVESWISIEIPLNNDRDEVSGLQARLTAVLGDVRAAVEDWPRMREQARALAQEFRSAAPTQVSEQESREAADFLDWLAAGSFTFIGYREYLLGEPADDDGTEELHAVNGSGLGILRFDATAADARQLTPAVAQKSREPHVLIVTKANSRSTVHRSAYLDYVGVKSFDESGAVIGERRFLGLFTANVYSESVLRVPLVSDRVRAALAMSGFGESGHDARDLVEALNQYPRDELFQTDAEELLRNGLSIVRAKQRRELRVFVRKDVYDRFISVLVYLPRDRYNTRNRLKIEAVLRELIGSDLVDYTTSVGESTLAQLHFVIRMPRGVQVPDIDTRDVEGALVTATRSWSDGFAEAVGERYSEPDTADRVKHFAGAFPEGYKEDFSARDGVVDLSHLDEVDARRGEGHLGLNLYRPLASSPDERRMKVYRDTELSLSTILPFLTDLGVEVTDERPYRISTADGTPYHIYDFGLRAPDASRWSEQPDARPVRERVHEALRAAWDGRIESDQLQGLILRTGLDARQVSILRAFTRYLRQAGTTFTASYITSTLVTHEAITVRLVQLFETRFAPGLFADDEQGMADRDSAQQTHIAAIEAALDEVASLDHDRILRWFLQAIRAVLRTNAYQRDADGELKDYLSFKLDPRQVPGLPSPKPRFEIWVYSPRVEGVHLRFGPVARGGLRWSDRREDFRTEILGLVKAQMIKNAVIVPTGSKGGFYAKQLPDPAVDRDAWLAEGIGAYTVFICGLLDLTDNRVGTQIVPPADVVRHDGDDPYLVVAADKGTATFSDTANGIATSYGFWLDDAFASGGSQGYDHKGMGITARGAWESVKRHFRELGHDTQSEDFTVVGVGDMSGDVFGNGMLLSEHIRLVCAFDHRHIFIDPDPDAASSYAERRRLFDLPRSSWADYDSSLISAGGGVYPRSQKAIPVTPEMAQAFGLTDPPATMTPTEIMQAALLAPVDLLWNGGIGTYLKASTEANAEVGDRANDAIRVDGNQVRAKVIGEGGNLGVTQRGRIEAALAGVRVNSDAIDNSAGVDTSDHEVNIKILLTGLIRSGDLTMKQRNELLASMTDEVAALVLRDNYEQNVLLGNARAQHEAMAPVHQRLMGWLEGRGELDRDLEALPDDATLDERVATGTGLTSPESSVLVAYSKLALKTDLQASGLADDPWLAQALLDYFPGPIRERFADAVAEHPLRTEIIVNSVANSVVNRGGITFAYRAMEESGAGPEAIARAFVVSREIFDLAGFVAQVEELDGVVSTGAQSALYLELRRLLDRAVRWFLETRPGRIDIGAEIETFAEPARWLTAHLPELLSGDEAQRCAEQAAQYVEAGIPQPLAERAAALLDLYSVLELVTLSQRLGAPVEDLAPVYFAVSDRFGVDALLNQVSDLPRESRWDALARAAMRNDLYSLLSELTGAVVASADPSDSAEQAVERWASLNGEALARARTSLDGIRELPEAGLAPLSVGVRTLRSVIGTARTQGEGAE